MESNGDGLYLYSAKNPICRYSPALYNPGNFSFQYFSLVPDIDITTQMLEKLRHIRHHKLISNVTLSGSQGEERRLQIVNLKKPTQKPDTHTHTVIQKPEVIRK